MLPRSQASRVEMWVMVHPVRFRIFEALGAGPATSAQLARELGESRGSTSYHLRMLARAGAIVEDEERGTRRERWWRRAEPPGWYPTDADPEGREITTRLFGMFFARDAEARRRFMTNDVDDAWHEASTVGNWYVDLTPAEAMEVGKALLETALHLRRQHDEQAEGVRRTLVSVSVLPWLGAEPES